MINLYSKKTFILTLLLFAALSAPLYTYALELDYPPIPTPIGPLDLNTVVDQGGFTVAGLVLFIYGAAVWIGGMLAFITLVYVGFTFIVSGSGVVGRGKAKRRLKEVLYGLAILLFVGVLLNTINPEILDLEDPLIVFVAPGTDEFTGFTYEHKTEVEGGGGTSNFSCTYVTAPTGDTSAFSCIYTNGECVPEGGDACEAGYAEDLCSSYNNQDNAEFLCNSVPQQECPADPNAESGCVPVGGGACQAGYAADFCSTYDDKELECNSLPQLECPTGTGGGGGGGGGDCLAEGTTCTTSNNTCCGGFACVPISGGTTVGTCTNTGGSGGLLTPPNLDNNNTVNCTGVYGSGSPCETYGLTNAYYLLPTNSALYSRKADACSRGRLNLIQTIYTATFRWNQAGGPALAVRDLNEDFTCSGVDHATHNDGTHVDISVGSLSTQQRIDFAKLLVDTGVACGILHINSTLETEVNNYFYSTQTYMPWKSDFVRPVSGHTSHFHIRVKKPDGSCN